MPGLDVVRPADANETGAALGRPSCGNAHARPAWPSPARTCPSSTAPAHAKAATRSRQGRLRARTTRQHGDARRHPRRHRLRGAARRRGPRDASRSPASRTRVVSMPCREWFEEQTTAYREQGPAAVGPGPRQRRGRVSMGWHDLVGDAGATSASSTSAPRRMPTLFREFGFTPRRSSRPPRTRQAAVGTRRGPGRERHRAARPAGHRHRRRHHESAEPQDCGQGREVSTAMTRQRTLKALADNGVSDLARRPVA